MTSSYLAASSIGDRMKDIEKLLSIAKRKNIFDQHNSWSNGSQTYLQAIKDEVDEVIEEIPKARRCYLEDELGDILWGYLNLLLSLEKEEGIAISSVLRRACTKYDERILGIEAGKSWSDIKERQKSVLEKEDREAL